MRGSGCEHLDVCWFEQAAVGLPQQGPGKQRDQGSMRQPLNQLQKNNPGRQATGCGNGGLPGGLALEWVGHRSGCRSPIGSQSFFGSLEEPNEE